MATLNISPSAEITPAKIERARFASIEEATRAYNNLLTIHYELLKQKEEAKSGPEETIFCIGEGAY